MPNSNNPEPLPNSHVLFGTGKSDANGTQGLTPAGRPNLPKWPDTYLHPDLLDFEDSAYFLNKSLLSSIDNLASSEPWDRLRSSTEGRRDQRCTTLFKDDSFRRKQGSNSHGKEPMSHADRAGEHNTLSDQLTKDGGGMSGNLGEGTWEQNVERVSKYAHEDEERRESEGSFDADDEWETESEYDIELDEQEDESDGDPDNGPDDGPDDEHEDEAGSGSEYGPEGELGRERRGKGQ